MDKIKQSDLREVVVTNTVPLPPAENARGEKKRRERLVGQQKLLEIKARGAGGAGTESPAAKALRSLKLKMSGDAAVVGAEEAGEGEVVITQLSVASVRNFASLLPRRRYLSREARE